MAHGTRRIRPGGARRGVARRRAVVQPARRRRHDLSRRPAARRGHGLREGRGPARRRSRSTTTTRRPTSRRRNPMPTEPAPTTLSEVVRRAVEICEPDGLSGDMERFMLEFEDRDEPIRVGRRPPRRDEHRAGARRRGRHRPGPPDGRGDHDRTSGSGATRSPTTTWRSCASRRAAEWQGHVPDDVAGWLESRESRCRTTGSAGHGSRRQLSAARAPTTRPRGPTGTGLFADAQAHGHGVQRGQPDRLGGGADVLRAAVAVPGADRAGLDPRPLRRPADDDADDHRHRHQIGPSSAADTFSGPIESITVQPQRRRDPVRRRPRRRAVVGVRLRRRVHARRRTSSTRRPRAGRSGSCARCSCS